MYLLLIRILVISTQYSIYLFLWLYSSLKNKYLSILVNIARSFHDDNFKDFIISSFTKKCCTHFVILLFLMCPWSYESVYFTRWRNRKICCTCIYSITNFKMTYHWMGVIFILAHKLLFSKGVTFWLRGSPQITAFPIELQSEMVCRNWQSW